MQHLQQYQQNPYQQQNLQYTTVQNLENRARSRNPLNGLGNNDLDHQQQTQYSTMAQLSSNPIDVWSKSLKQNFKLLIYYYYYYLKLLFF